MVVKHIHYSNCRKCNLHQVWTLSHYSTNQQTTIRSATDCKKVRRCIFIFYKIFCSRNEIIKYVLLIHFSPGKMPFFTIFTTSSYVWDSINTASLKPESNRNTESRGLTYIET